MNTPDDRSDRKNVEIKAEGQTENKNDRKLQLGKRVLKHLVVRTDVRGGMACDTSRWRCCG